MLLREEVWIETVAVQGDGRREGRSNEIKRWKGGG